MKVFSKKYNQKSIVDIIPLDLDIYRWKTIELTLIATDEKWYEDKKILDLKVISYDDDKPVLYKKDLTNNQILLFFIDNTSWVEWGKIYSNWKLIKEFKGNIVSLSWTNFKNLTYEVKDYYWNIAEGEIKF
jgi:hypothetical protein